MQATRRHVKDELQVDSVTVEWGPDPTSAEEEYCCQAKAQVSYAYADGTRRLEWLTSGGLYRIDAPYGTVDSAGYRDEVAAEQIADLRHHLTHFDISFSDREWRTLVIGGGLVK